MIIQKMPCCPLPAGYFFVGMWFMPTMYNNIEYRKAKREASRLRTRYISLMSNLHGHVKYYGKQEEIEQMEQRITAIEERYSKLASFYGFNPLPRQISLLRPAEVNYVDVECSATKRYKPRWLRRLVKTNTKQCQTCGKFDGTDGASCPNCPGMPSYGKGPAKVSAEKRDWKAPDGTIVSDIGSNEVQNRFYSKKELDEHFHGVFGENGNKLKDGHKENYPGLSENEYTEKAAKLASSQVGGNIRGFSRDNGDVVRYDRQTGDFVIAVPGKNGFVRTLYKVSLVYFDTQKANTWKFRRRR